MLNEDGRLIPDQQINVRSLALRHGSWASVGTACSLLFALLSTLILARVLSPADFARFTVVRTGAAFLGTLAAFGLGTTALTHLGRFDSEANPERKQVYLLKIAGVAAVTSATFAIIAFATTILFGKSLTGTPMTVPVAITIAIATAGGGILAVSSDSIRGVGSLSSASLLGNAMQGSPVLHVVTLSSVILVWFSRLPTWYDAVAGYTVACSLAAVCGCMILCRLVLKGDKSVRWKADSEVVTVRQILASSWPLAVLASITFILGGSDLFMTSRFANPDSAADYVASRRAIVLLAIPMSVLNTAVRGMISPLYSANMRQALQRSLRAGSGLVAIPCLAAGVSAMFYPVVVLRLILGEGYEGAAPILQVLIPGQIVFVLSGCCGTLLNLTGHQRTTLAVNSMGAAVFLTLGPWVAARFGAIGLATLMSLMQAILNLVIWMLAIKLTGINTMFSFRALSGWRSFIRRPTVSIANDGSDG
ncbi:MAG: oligosaccharide flippase family protein [Planctomycetaceae bacterium]